MRVSIEAVGEGVRHLKPGDPVAAFGGTGGFGTHACVPAALSCHCPQGFAFDDAAAFILIYGTTHHALLDRGALRLARPLLVLGAAGGVGTAAIQIGKVAGRPGDRRSVERREAPTVSHRSAPTRPSTTPAGTCARSSRR